MLDPLLNLGRYMILLGVIGSMLAAFACLIYGVAEVVLVIAKLFKRGAPGKGARALAVSFLEAVDLFLIGTVFYIIAVGLYELFINDNAPMPGWLVIRDLDDLKLKLINGIVLILAIYFLGALVDWNGRTDLLRLSISIALIIAVLTVFEYATSKGGHGAGTAPEPGGKPPAAVHEGEH